MKISGKRCNFLQIQLLGTSGFGITKTRKLPSSIINNEIIVDMGEGTLATLIAQRHDISKIKAILITHMHADHSLGLLSLLYSLAFYQLDVDFSKKRMSPPIYIPENMKKNLDAIIEATSSTFFKVNYELDIRELIADDPVREIKITTKNNTYKVEWQKTVHSPICYAYKINGKLVLSGDTAPFPEMTEFCKGAKTLIHESSFPDGMEVVAHRVNHSCPSDVAKLAKDANIDQILLCHVPDLARSDEEAFLQKAKKLYANIAVAHDGDIVTF